ncbi:hypothetical protein SAMN05428957_101200 [Oryzisolibacter propanilivorax]|uniref:Uncharacterized protein n=1 Tax=Oryzisolibacter propanilivorax TaxID=1527607 RepID=A0A1G9P4X1_9BURK|nr:hypothetical protein [Oryzisolibacter propanilivorax]SDL93826.1 hypothetical protein SAMN05428957_101200 [Oryzisolibacter propanilivorax]
MTSRLTTILPPSGRPVARICSLTLLAALGHGLACAQDSLGDAAQLALAHTGTSAAPLDSIAPATFTSRSEELTALAASLDSPPVPGLRLNEVTGWLTPDRPSSLGVTLGVLSASDPGNRQGSAAALAYDLGLRWRSRLEQRVHLDVQAWARTPQPAFDAITMIWSREPASVGTRLEVQWKASRTRGVVPEFGAIGVQLQGDAKLLLRARHGGPMVYYRTKF